MVKRPTREKLLRAWSVLRKPTAVRVIVLGHQKSGTSAIGALMARLIKHSYANDPLYWCDHGRGEYANRVVNDPGTLRQVINSKRAYFFRYIVKDPDLTFVMEDLPYAFPNARLIFVVRDPRQVIRSIADRLNLSADTLSKPFQATPDINRHWSLILSGQLPIITNRNLAVSEVLARRWIKSVEMYLRNEGRVLMIRYEDFCAHKLDSLRQLIRQMNIRERGDISEWVNAEHQPKDNSQADLEIRLGLDSLVRIEKLCSNHMSKFQYSPTPNSGS